MEKLTALFLCVCMVLGLRMSALSGAEPVDLAVILGEHIRAIDEQIREIKESDLDEETIARIIKDLEDAKKEMLRSLRGNDKSKDSDAAKTDDDDIVPFRVNRPSRGEATEGDNPDGKTGSPGNKEDGNREANGATSPWSRESDIPSGNRKAAETPFDRFGGLNGMEVRVNVIYEHTDEKITRGDKNQSELPWMTVTGNSSIKRSKHFKVEWRGVLRPIPLWERAYPDRPEYKGVLEANVSGKETSERIEEGSCRVVDPDDGSVSTTKEHSAEHQEISVSGHYSSGVTYASISITPEGYIFNPPGGFMQMPGNFRSRTAMRGSHSGKFGKELLNIPEHYDNEKEWSDSTLVGSHLSIQGIKKPFPGQGLILTGQDIFAREKIYKVDADGHEGFSRDRNTVTWAIGPASVPDPVAPERGNPNLRPLPPPPTTPKTDPDELKRRLDEAVRKLEEQSAPPPATPETDPEELRRRLDEALRKLEEQSVPPPATPEIDPEERK